MKIGKNLIGNAFSAGMLSGSANVKFIALSLEDAEELVKHYKFTSCIGHADTALLVSSLLKEEFPMNRCSTVLEPGDSLLIAQYNGPRLPEGATVLPEGAKIRWFFAEVSEL